jgi:NAD(P)H-dependent FMN reductase
MRYIVKRYFIACCVLFATSLLAKPNVLMFAGSTREGSINKKLVKAAAIIAEEMGAKVTVIDLRDFPMPIYDWDLEQKEGNTENIKKLRNLFLTHDVVVISAPEYNASIPGVLKNAIDWLSRDNEGRRSYAAFEKKTFAIMSCSGGKTGGAKVLSHLQDALEELGGEVAPKQLTLPRASVFFNSQSELTNTSVKNELRDVLSGVLKDRS